MSDPWKFDHRDTGLFLKMPDEIQRYAVVYVDGKLWGFIGTDIPAIKRLPEDLDDALGVSTDDPRETLARTRMA